MRTRWLAAFALVSSLAACVDETDDVLSEDDEDGDAYDPFSPKADGNQGLGGAISFTAKCEPGDRVTIAAVGDVLLHGPLQQQAVARASSGRFKTLWAPVEDLLAQADTTYANFEGPSARGTNSAGRSVTDPGFVFDQIVYASYPQFNYHGHLPADLKASGFDVVSTANNHSMDRRQRGADLTVEAMQAAGLPFTGTRSRADMSAPWHTITEANGFTLAWLACTYGTNGLPDPDNQVLGCWDDETTIKTTIRTLRATPGIDAVIVTPHWGVEYSANPSREQRDLAHRFLDAGATIVLGSHPHVLQPWEKYTTPDGREGFVIYSLGNFVSNQSQLARRSTLLLYVGLTRTASGVKINGVRYIPMIMGRTGTLAVEAIDRAGGSVESRRMTVGMFGSENIQDPAQPLDTTPGCP